ncbi:hypothetical protein [Aneurinibacillus tyrosinisolvens]|uniref:hypothetical protein n=1 Tax=Aneurinibacillus tyrosinisolvens TaxID=1443435 RepID=UPI00063F1FF9|nr:hypothetical protein [Aneurinibacillus tyrosinisolvens]
MDITVKVNRYIDSLREVTYYLISINTKEGLLRNDSIEKVLGTSYRDLALKHGGIIENGNEIYFRTREEAEEVQEILKDMLRDKYNTAFESQLKESFGDWEVEQAPGTDPVILKDVLDQNEQPIAVFMAEDVYLLPVPGTEDQFVNAAGFQENREQYRQAGNEAKYSIMSLSDKGMVIVDDRADEILTWDVLEELSEIYKNYLTARQQYFRHVK